MNETDVDLNRRITELEKRLGYANNRFILAVVLVLLGIGMNVWWMIRPVREIRVTDGLSTARLTPTELTITTSLGTGRVNTVMMELEEPSGKPLVGLNVGPRREGNMLLIDASGDESLTREELSRLRRSLPNAETSKTK